MKVVLLLAGFLAGPFLYSGQNSFLNAQRKFPRVNAAFNHKEAVISEKLKKLNLETGNLDIMLVAFKAEKTVAVFVKNREAVKYRKLQNYPVCALSGKPGPKLMQGDGQIPEGFYEIDRFHPESKFHLALGINYPNAADKIRSGPLNPGGDIFIHGSCKTIGCLPMTDDLIQEMYVLAVLARNSGQKKIPVYIFPFRLSDENLAEKEIIFNADEDMSQFRRNLKTGYDRFQATSEALKISVEPTGNYAYK